MHANVNANARTLTLDSSKDLTSSAAAAAFLPALLTKTSLILGSTLDFQMSMAGYVALGRQSKARRQGSCGVGQVQQQQQQHGLASNQCPPTDDT